MIQLDSSHDSTKNKVLFKKTGALVLGLWLDTSSEPKCLKCGFLVLDPEVNTFFETS